MEDLGHSSDLNSVAAKIWSDEEVAKAHKRWGARGWGEVVADAEAKLHGKLTSSSQAWECEKRLLMEIEDSLKGKFLSLGKDAVKIETDC